MVGALLSITIIRWEPGLCIPDPRLKGAHAHTNKQAHTQCVHTVTQTHPLLTALARLHTQK